MASHYGRYKILTDLIPTGNIEKDEKIIPQIIERSKPFHDENVRKMEELYNYFFNHTDIENKTKTTRNDVNNKISKPICYIACVRKNSYCFGKPFQFISSQAEQKKQNEVKAFTDALSADSYESHLTETTLHSSWSALGYKYITKPSKEEIEDGMYFKTVSDIDPRQAFVVYENSMEKEPVLGVVFYNAEEVEGEGPSQKITNVTVYNVFTKWHKWVFKCKGTNYQLVPFNIFTGKEYISLNGFPYRFDVRAIDGKVVAKQSTIPLIEYQRNPQRINDFEIAKGLIDAANMIISCAVDKIQQNVDYVLKLKDIDVGEWDDEGKNPIFDRIMKYLAANILPIKSNEGAITQPDATILDVPLDITQVKDLLEFIKQEIYESLFIPTRGNGVGQDTGKAVERRNGFTELEDFAGITVTSIKDAERKFVRVALEIAREINGCPFKELKSKDIIIKDTRNNIEDMQEQTQAFATLIGAGVNRTTAYEITKIVADAIDTTKLDEAYAEQQLEIQQKMMAAQKQNNNEDKESNEDDKKEDKKEDSTDKEVISTTKQN